jgi:drug/metabolite transporter (DMT)-like permease
LLLLAGGNGLVVWSEQFVDAGTASIYVVTVAVWSAVFDAAWAGGTTRFSWRLAAGLLLGFAGSFVLTGVTPRNLFSVDWRGPLALVTASASWAFGTVYLKRHQVTTPFTMSAAVQMLAGALGLSVIGLLLGETARWHPTTGGLLAVAYLIVFGSIVGFTAYGYALRHASATVVGTYSYVNPVVAVLLGWLLLHEPMSARKLVAMAVILTAVVWIQSTGKPQVRKSVLGGKQPAPA